MPALIFLIFTYFAEALIVYSYAKSVYEEKRNSIITFGVIFLSYVALLVIFKFLFKNEIFNIFSIIIVNILNIKFLFNSSFKSAVFHGSALGICQLLSEFFTAYISAMILNISTQESVNTHFELGAISSMMLYFLISRLLSRFSVKENNSHSWGKWFSLSLLPIGSLLVLISFRVITNSIILTSSENTFLIVAVSFLLIINIIVYLIYEQAEKSNQKLVELELINQKNDIDMQYLNLLEKKNETMNVMAHDYKNHIMTISNMSDSPEIKDYINNMIGEITKYNQIGKTQNRLLDVILSKYRDICKENGIKFETDIMSDNLKFISNYDLSAMLNNILDNAVEAAVKSAVKLIHIEIANSLSSYHKITIINSCDNEPKSNKDKLITTKRDKNTHGFGTKSIRKIVNKYDGELRWEFDNSSRQFKLVILFPNEQ
ncbi:MAG: GHKL domain-containing protein [Acetobacter sp.]|nr:GHKL domain-containing protein [Bacteroides sp.]MCM1341801.1 GHKL domain-containing protein [Acetobacter sp.]MCM1433143.1 GHKL domain-containing protein [Clostridiales bacterium]